MAELVYNSEGRLLFTEEMRKEYTILIPQMIPIHFTFLERIFNNHGYKTELLRTTGRKIVDEGLKNVHNDTCYPALLVIGQFMDALKSGKYDIHKTALMITQTGGGCRASNYIHLLRKALKNCGWDFIPVISLNVSGMEPNPGFRLTPGMLMELFTGILYGDVLMMAANQVRPYEVNKGDADRMVEKWTEKLVEMNFTGRGFYKRVCEIFHDFEQIPYREEERIKVGIVGEVYIKFSALGNNGLEAFLAEEGAEVVVPGLIDMMMFMCDHYIVENKLYHVGYKKFIGGSVVQKALINLQGKIIKAAKQTRFRPPADFAETKRNAAPYVSPANKMGEGWLLTAEMLELINSGVLNIVCAQPFGCLPNHVVGKGMVRKLRTVHPEANIVAIDYDPGATRVNQENRIKLMLATAKTMLAEKKNGA